MTAPRSSQPQIRNPVLQLPAARKLAQLPTEQRALIAELLTELGADAGARAQASWRRHKAPMAAYWKTTAVYARHIARAIRPRPAGAQQRS